jgi:hypothetical protein
VGQEQLQIPRRRASRNDIAPGWGMTLRPDGGAPVDKARGRPCAGESKAEFIHPFRGSGGGSGGAAPPYAQESALTLCPTLPRQ